MGTFCDIFGSPGLTSVTSIVVPSSIVSAKKDQVSSEPLLKNGVTDATPSDLYHSQSEFLFQLSKFWTKPIIKKLPPQLLCPPSPTPTEVDYPDSQYIINFIESKGIKVYDYAYSSPSAHHLPPVPEIFDQYRGLAEVEYRWSQSHRTYPIQGKTLSRLIDMGWISQAELSARAAPMDLEELQRHNARQPTYPWKPFRWTVIPTSDERKEFTQSIASDLFQWDKIRAEAEFQEIKRLAIARETEQVEERIRQRERQNEKYKETMGYKRRLEVDDGNDEESGVLEGTNPKRRRLPDIEDFYISFLIPSKQYPAALHTYDPDLYPEAAYVIGLSSQLQPHAVTPKINTPPINGDEDTKQSGVVALS